MKKLSKILSVFLVVLILATAVPTTASAASYPVPYSMYIADDIIVQGDIGVLEIGIESAYYNEGYYVEIYDSYGNSVGYAENYYYTEDYYYTFDITIDTAALGMGADTYTAACWTYYYTNGSWKESPYYWEYEFYVVPAVTEGWNYLYGDWYYVENGYIVTDAWRKDSKGWCYLGSDGFMLTNTWLQDSDGWCYIGSDGYCVTGTYYVDGAYHNFDSEGNWLGQAGSTSSGMSNGWNLVNGKWYFVENGSKVTNAWRSDSSGWCYLGSDGAMLTNTWIQDSDGWCYIGPNGYCVTGSYYVDGAYHNFDSEGNWLGEAGSTSSGMSEGWNLVDGQWYFVENGSKVTNAWRRDSSGWCYLGSNGAMVTNQWLQDSDGWCYIGPNGYCVTGTYYVDGAYHNFDSEGNWLGAA